MVYDPQMIQQHAERLIKQSRSIVPIQFFIGVFSGMIIFGGVTAWLDIGFDFLIIAIGVLIGGVMGYGSGQNRSFELKLQAQTALCQAQIENNTRKN